MNGEQDRILDDAAAWHAASLCGTIDWEAFASWLEADPRHRAAFDEIALADDLLGDHRDALRHQATPANDEPALDERPAMHRRSLWFRWAGAAIAASLIALLAVPQLMQPAAAIYTTEGEARTIALKDGSVVILAPRSRLEIAGRSDQRMALNGGAWFDIRHDPARPLSISAGGVEISDIGTQFDVQADAGQVRIEVAQGTVSVASSALSQPVKLAQGRGLTFAPDEGTAFVKPIDPTQIGEWRQGQLSFDAAPLALVAADLSRYAGLKVTVAKDLRDRNFSGTLVIGDDEAALRDLSQVMDIDLRSSNGTYRLERRTR